MEEIKKKEKEKIKIKGPIVGEKKERCVKGVN